MSTHHALRAGATGACQGAAARTPFRSEPVSRRPTDSPDRLERLSDRLDVLIRDVRSGFATSHREYEARVAEAEAIADGLRAVFCAPTPTGPVNAPLKIELLPDGRSRGAW
ncbi:MAG: hypothetical protein QOH47_829 [Sphingomonadales bacterium]|jgi:hypothetical protein|nr:hypothetical protein [Sphingomonadales bacterium]